MKSCFHTDIGMAGMDINSLEALLSSSPLQFLEVLSPEDFLSGVFCGTCSVKELLADSIMMLLILKDYLKCQIFSKTFISLAVFKFFRIFVLVSAR